MQGVTCRADFQPLIVGAYRLPTPNSAAGSPYLATELCISTSVRCAGREKSSNLETGMSGANHSSSVA